MHLRHCFVFLILTYTLTVTAQEMPVYSQYILNEFILNPAMAGYDGMTSINLTGRKQWLGLKNAPETYSAGISSRILKSPFKIKRGKYKKGSQGRVGLGLLAISDKNGALQRTNLEATYAYHIYLDKIQVSFGSSIVLSQMSIDPNLIEFNKPGDPVYDLLGKSSLTTDAKFGFSFESKKISFGVCASNLFQSVIRFGDAEYTKGDLQQQRNYTITSHYRVPLNRKYWEIEPSTIIRFDEQFNFSADFSARIIYDNQYWGGMSIRTSGEMVLLMGIKLNRIYFGYSFDYGFNQLSRLSYGSHEVSLALKLGDSTRRYRWQERY